jgi:hypothetical protein
MYSAPIRQLSLLWVVKPLSASPQAEGSGRLCGASKEWVVERFFAWISRNRRLWKDAGATIKSAMAFLYAASIVTLVRQIRRRTRIKGRTLSSP